MLFQLLFLVLIFGLIRDLLLENNKCINPTFSKPFGKVKKNSSHIFQEYHYADTLFSFS